jgi:hypothetical protein
MTLIMPKCCSDKYFNICHECLCDIDIRSLHTVFTRSAMYVIKIKCCITVECVFTLNFSVIFNIIYVLHCSWNTDSENVL